MHPADENRANYDPDPRWQPAEVGSREDGPDDRARRRDGGEMLGQEPRATGGLLVEAVALGMRGRLLSRVEAKEAGENPPIPAIGKPEDDARDGEEKNQ